LEVLQEQGQRLAMLLYPCRRLCSHCLPSSNHSDAKLVLVPALELLSRGLLEPGSQVPSLRSCKRPYWHCPPCYSHSCGHGLVLQTASPPQ
jgi:hypothetical protein